jgi:hypothetical protein
MELRIAKIVPMLHAAQRQTFFQKFGSRCALRSARALALRSELCEIVQKIQVSAPTFRQVLQIGKFTLGK